MKIALVKVLLQCLDRVRTTDRKKDISPFDFETLKVENHKLPLEQTGSPDLK